MLGRLKDQQGQWRRVDLTHHRHWRRVGSRAAARKKTGNGGIWLSLFSPSFPRRRWPAITTKKRNKAVGFSFSPFLDLFSVFLLPLDFLLFPPPSGVQRHHCLWPFGWLKTGAEAAGWRRTDRESVGAAVSGCYWRLRCGPG